jgi:hypothetical protein
MPDVLTIDQYFLTDYPRTLFPLTTTRVLIEGHSQHIKDFLYDTVLTATGDQPGFLSQQRCHAAKRGYHLRRTVKLDPVAEYFLYDVILRNRRLFRPDDTPTRRTFGYRFPGGHPESNAEAYGAFKAALAVARGTQDLTLRADVATYFNSLYSHDLVHMVEALRWDATDVRALGRFLREANAGRSVDCLPHGMHPSKVIGSEFLRFVDNSPRIKSSLSLRFMDDIHLFDSDEKTLTSDLVALQEVLGEKALSLNETKTALGAVGTVDVPKQVDAMKESLLRIRRRTIEVSDETIEADDHDPIALSSAQIDYLLQLLSSPDIEEADAELVLVLLRDHATELLPRIEQLLGKFPGLTRNVYFYAGLASDRTGLDEAVAEFLSDADNATEYQLFWLGKLAEDYFGESDYLREILMAILEHPRGTPISRAKVLEIPESRFGLPDLREQVLRSGKSDWEAWAAAAGSRGVVHARRNHLLKYFAKGSPLNALIARCVSAMP